MEDFIYKHFTLILTAVLLCLLISLVFVAVSPMQNLMYKATDQIYDLETVDLNINDYTGNLSGAEIRTLVLRGIPIFYVPKNAADQAAVCPGVSIQSIATATYQTNMIKVAESNHGPGGATGTWKHVNDVINSGDYYTARVVQSTVDNVPQGILIGFEIMLIQKV